MSGGDPARRWRFCLAAAVAAYAAALASFPGLLRFLGVSHYGHWFLDGYAILAANDAVGAGLNPWAPNPLDPLNRPHVYSHWWLQLRTLGLTRAHAFAFGAALGGAFLAAALARLRPRSAGECGWYLAVLGAGPVVLAVERANNDLAVFALLAPVVPCLRAERRAVRWLAIGWIAVATALKFYPAVAAIVLLAGGEAREVRRRAVFGGLALALVAVAVGPDLARIAGLMPRAEGPMTFGAINLLEALGLRGPAATAAGLLAAGAIALGFLRAGIFSGWKIAPADRGAWWSFTLGAALLTGCFFAGTSYGYRWVFAVWLAPLLWRLPRDPAAPAAVRRLACATAALLIFALWSGALLGGAAAWLGRDASPAAVAAWADRFFLIEQPFAWALFACLLGFLAHFAREGWRTLSGRAEPPSAR